MAPIKLTKKPISGYGHYHRFRNDTTQEIVEVKCTQKEYELLSIAGGNKHNPKKPGHTWVCSFGGTVEVEGRPLKEGEHVELPNGEQIACINGRGVIIEPKDLDENGDFIGIIRNP